MKPRPNQKSDETDHRLFEAITAIQNAEEAEQFFYDLCTPAEIQAMKDRWRVVDLIKNQKPYRQIYEETGVSCTTVGRVARFLTMGAGGYELIYTRLKQKNENQPTKNCNSKKRAFECGLP